MAGLLFRIFNFIVLMIGLMAACCLDSENFVLPLVVTMVCATYLIAVGVYYQYVD